MNSFTLLYLFYSAKLCSQASIYFIWLEDSTSGKIAFIAAAVAVLAIFPFFHVLVHVFSAKPLSNSTFIAYLCFRWRSLSSIINSLLIHPLSFLLAILWYEPTRDGAQCVLPFALVTTADLLALLIFLFNRQISHWHDVLTWDTEQGQDIDDASVTFVGRGNEHVERRDLGARPETPQSELRRLQALQESGYDIDAINRLQRGTGSSNGIDTIGLNPRSVVGRSSGPAAGGRGFDPRLDCDEPNGRFAGAEAAMQRSSNIGWGHRMVRPISEGEMMEEGRASLELGQQVRRSGIFINLGLVVDNDADSGFETIHPCPPVGTPVTIYGNIHPALRSTFDGTSQPVSPDGFQTPRQAPSPTGMSMLEPNQF